MPEKLSAEENAAAERTSNGVHSKNVCFLGGGQLKLVGIGFYLRVATPLLLPTNYLL